MKIHTNLCEDGNIFDNYAMRLDKFVPFFTSSGPLEDEQLICLLLIHYQDFATDDGKVFLILALLDSNHLVRLSGIGFQ